MERWTMEQLERTDDLDFAICILNERRNRLNPYSPLAMKLGKAVNAIGNIKAEKDAFLSRITATDTLPEPGEELEPEECDYDPEDDKIGGENDG